MKKTINKTLSWFLSVTMLFSVFLIGDVTDIKVNASGGNVTFGGKTVWLEYGPGDYFTDNRKACTDHGTSGIHSATNEAACNCKCTYNGTKLGACQCFGYARYIQTILFGKNSYNSSGSFYKVSGASVSVGNLTADKLKSIIKSGNVKPGAHIRTNGSAHSLIITQITDSGFSIIQANGSNNNEYSGYNACRVGTYTYTWSSYVNSTYGKRGIDYIEMPYDYNIPDNSPSYVDVGTDFVATINDVKVGKPVRTVSSGNIELTTSKGNIDEKWWFIRQADGTYIIESLNNNNYITITGTGNGSNVTTSKYTGSDSQKWYLYSADGNYELAPKSSMGKRMNLGGGTTGDGTNIIIWEEMSGSKDVQFKINKCGTKYIYNLGTNFLANITDVKVGKLVRTASSGNIELTTSKGNIDEKWWFIRQADGTYIIESLYNNNYITATEIGNGSNVTTSKYLGSDSQKWYVYPSNGKFELAPKSSVGKRMNLAGGLTDDGTNIIIWEEMSGSNDTRFSILNVGSRYIYNHGTEFVANINDVKVGKSIKSVNGNVELGTATGSLNEKWYFTRQLDGSYFIKSLSDNNYITVSGGSNNNGTNIVTSQYTGKSEQRWFIYPYNNKFELVPKCAMSSRMNLAGGSTSDKTNIVLWEEMYGSNDNLFNISNKTTLNTIKFTISYNTNGGNGSISNQTKIYGQDLTLSSTKPTRTGYTFIGWSTSANATTAQYQPGGKYTANSGATLYAIWKRTDENLGTYKYSNPRKTTLYARISYSGTNKYITNISDNSNNDNTYKNVQLKNENGSLQQVWEFEKLSNGGYKISSVYDGRVLDIYQTKTINGTNIGACGTYYANDGQVWYLLKNIGKYVIQPKASTGVYLGVANTSDGGNVQVTTSAHLFNIEILKPVGKSTMKVVQEGTSVSPTKLSWTAATDATWYNLYVYDGEVWKSNCVYSKQKIKGLEWSFQLPPGTYQAHLSPINIHNWTNSNFVSFTIKENKYTINYNPNGGSGTMDTQTLIFGENFTIPENKFVKTGYDFCYFNVYRNSDGKWYTSENGWQTESEIKRLGYSKRNYNVGEKYTMSKNWTSDLSSDLSFTFYPVWREKQVTIKYDLNGGTGTISPTYKKLDIECTLSTTKPTKTDYTFAGWSADKNSTVAQYQPGEKYTGNKDVTLYAVWVSNQYTINISTTNCKVNITATFNGNRIEVSYGDKVPYGAKLSYEAQADYGYYFGVDLNNSNKAIISKTSEEIVVTDDVNIAEKAYLKNYRITAYTYAGGYSPIISNRDYAPYNTYITVTAGEAFEGYQFIGWYLNGQCVSTDKVYQVKMTSNISIYAKYKKIA